MEFLRICTVLFFAVALAPGCTMKGYRIDLKADRPDQAIERVREVLLGSGFERDNSNENIQIERYRKNPSQIKRTFFNRNADYWVRVDIRPCSQGSGPKGEGFEVHIYNVYVGNSPEVKPLLTKTADSIEEAISKTAPDVEVQRSEGLTGIPFI